MVELKCVLRSKLAPANKLNFHPHKHSVLRTSKSPSGVPGVSKYTGIGTSARALYGFAERSAFRVSRRSHSSPANRSGVSNLGQSRGAPNARRKPPDSHTPCNTAEGDEAKRDRRAPTHTDPSRERSCGVAPSHRPGRWRAGKNWKSQRLSRRSSMPMCRNPGGRLPAADRWEARSSAATTAQASLLGSSGSHEAKKRTSHPPYLFGIPWTHADTPRGLHW